MNLITNTIVPIACALVIVVLSAHAWLIIARHRVETGRFFDETVRFNEETMRAAKAVRQVSYELVKYQRDLVETLINTEPVGDSVGLDAWAKLNDAVKRFEMAANADD